MTHRQHDFVVATLLTSANARHCILVTRYDGCVFNLLERLRKWRTVKIALWQFQCYDSVLWRTKCSPHVFHLEKKVEVFTAEGCSKSRGDQVSWSSAGSVQQIISSPLQTKLTITLTPQAWRSPEETERQLETEDKPHSARKFLVQWWQTGASAGSWHQITSYLIS